MPPALVPWLVGRRAHRPTPHCEAIRFGSASTAIGLTTAPNCRPVTNAARRRPSSAAKPVSRLPGGGERLAECGQRSLRDVRSGARRESRGTSPGDTHRSTSCHRWARTTRPTPTPLWNDRWCLRRCCTARLTPPNEPALGTSELPPDAGATESLIRLCQQPAPDSLGTNQCQDPLAV